VDHRRLARKEKNREKETIISAGRLVDDLRTRQAVVTRTAPVTNTESTVPTQITPSVAPAARIVPIAAAPVAASDSTRVSPDPTDAVAVAVISDPPEAELFVDSIYRKNKIHFRGMHGWASYEGDLAEVEASVETGGQWNRNLGRTLPGCWFQPADARQYR
jgi:hypothetical protein